MSDFGQFVPACIRRLAEGDRARPLKQSSGGDKPIALNLNENPFGPSPLALKAIDTALANVHRYPEIEATELHDAIAALRYGCVSLNAWSAVGFTLPQVPWGAYRGDDRKADGSGCGVVHNSLLLAGTQKAVVYAPFSPFPKPPWYVTNRNQAAIGAALCDFELARSPAALAKIAFLSLTG